MKITFLGDIMCEPPVIKGGLKKDKSYNFDFVFADAKKVWQASKLLSKVLGEVANLLFLSLASSTLCHLSASRLPAM